MAKFCYYIVTGRITVGTRTLVSNAALDGVILESGETSSVGGTMNTASPIFNLGDDASNRQYRTVLSFNTAVLPDNAVITAVALKIRKAGAAGATPFNTLGNIAVDMRKGAFSSNGALQSSDFSAAPARMLL